MESIHFEGRVSLPVSPLDLWPLLADTARLNQAMRLPPVEYEVSPRADGGRQLVGLVRLGRLVLARWIEQPFRWEKPRGYLVVREFRGGLLGGLLSRVSGGVELTARSDGTEVLVYADVTPRNLLGALVARLLVGRRAVGGVIDQCHAFADYLSGAAFGAYPALANRTGLPSQVGRLVDELSARGLDPRAVSLLHRHLAEAPDQDVVNMRPFELADRWGLDRRATLALFLHATNAGLLVMSWDVLCPNCRVGKASAARLKDLRSEAHCEVCNIRFEPRFDRLVEVRFMVAPGVRQVERREFCLGGPMNTPHVEAQATVAAHGRESLRLELAVGAYRIRTDAATTALIEVGPAVAPSAAALRPFEVRLGWNGIEPSVLELTAGPVDLEVVNCADQDQRVVIESDVWPDTVATAALVSTIQEFRDLFSSEVLSPGLQLRIERLTFMFTDLTGSTALYQSVGQAGAFRLVQDHFVVLGSAIEQHRGALVKTIGDAVMATFADGADALAAALQIQRDIHGLTAPAGVDTSRLVKIGLHQGACLAVNLNDRLDYFGTAVNMAARIEHECRGGQIVASRAVGQADNVRAMLAGSGMQLDEEVVQLRGIQEPVAVYRIRPAPPIA